MGKREMKNQTKARHAKWQANDDTICQRNLKSFVNQSSETVLNILQQEDILGVTENLTANTRVIRTSVRKY